MLQRLEGDEALARELVVLFLQEYGNLQRTLGAAVEGGRPEQIRTAAHALKGCIGNFTDKGAYVTAADIEQRSAAESLSDVPVLLHRLAAELDDMAAQMRAFEAGS
jgi:HPt (histidine-containing phosphotransfer) domain-containing protein